MALITIERETNLNKVPISVDALHGMMFSKEAGAHKFLVTCTKDGEQVQLTGTVTAYVLLTNGHTQRLESGGTTPYTGIENGKAWATLHQACYAVPGRFQISIFVTDTQGVTTCVYAAVGVIQRSATDNEYDPGDAVPTINNLEAWIAACQQATREATAAANAVPDLVAETFATNKAYTAGSYVYYNGSLYRFTADHAAGAWTGSDATAVKLGNDVADLKSATNPEFSKLAYHNYTVDAVKGCWVTPTPSSGDATPSTPNTSYGDNYKCIEMSVASGDQFEIALGVSPANNHRLWAIIRSDRTVIARSSSASSETDVRANPISINIADYDGADKILINFDPVTYPNGYMIKTSEGLAKTISDIIENASTDRNDINTLQTKSSEQDELNTTFENAIIYQKKSQNLYGTGERITGLNISPPTITSSTISVGYVVEVDDSQKSITIDKNPETAGVRFRAALLSEYPKKALTILAGTSSDTKSSITLNVVSGAEYLFLVYYTTDTVGYTEEQVLDGMKIYYGDYIAEDEYRYEKQPVIDINKYHYNIPKYTDVVPFEALTGYTSAWNTAGFNAFYQLFHGLAIEYPDECTEINCDTEYLANNTYGDTSVPSSFSGIENAGMYMWHIPPLPVTPYSGYESNPSPILKLFLASGVHGAEKKAILGTYLLMKKLLENNDPAINVLRQCDIYIMPLRFPYGIENNTNKTADGVNLNRDFPVTDWKADPSDSTNTEPLSQYETRCTVYWFNKIAPDLAIDHHSFNGADGNLYAIEWGTSAFEGVVSEIYTNICNCSNGVRNQFPAKFSGYKFQYGYSRIVSKTSGTMSRWIGEQGVLGCTVECPMHLRFASSGDYLFGFTDEDESSLVSIAYYCYVNAVMRLVQYANCIKTSGVEISAS